MKKNTLIVTLVALIIGLMIAVCVVVSQEKKNYEIDEMNKDYGELKEVSDEHIQEIMNELLSVYNVKTNDEHITVEDKDIKAEVENKDKEKVESTENISITNNSNVNTNNPMDNIEEEIYSKIPQVEKDRIFKGMENYSIDEKVELFKYFYDVKLGLEQMIGGSYNEIKKELTDNEIREKIKNEGLEKLYCSIPGVFGYNYYDFETKFPTYKPLTQLAEVYLVKSAVKGQIFETTVGEYFSVNQDVEDAYSDVNENIWKKSGEKSKVFPDDPNGEYFGYKNHYKIAPHRFDCTCGSASYVEYTASSSLRPEGKFTYNAENLKYTSMNDEKSSRRTAWVEGVEGSGIGECFEVKEVNSSIDSDGTYVENLEEICIVNGYASNEKTFTENNRVKTLRFYFNDVEIGLINLKDTDKPQYIDVKSANLKFLDLQGVRCRFEIVDVYPGTKYDDTCVTGVMVKTVSEWYYE